MIEAMVSGKVIKDAEMKTSGSGKDYLVLIVRHDEMLVRVMAERLQRVKRGDAVAVVGSLTIGEWQSKPSYSLMAHRALSNVERRPPKAKPSGTAAQFGAAAHAQRAGDDLASGLPWKE